MRNPVIVICLLLLSSIFAACSSEMVTSCEDTMTCSTACTSDAECVNDPVFGPNHLCIDGECVSGNCREDVDCSNGQVCDDETHLCRACVDITEDERCGEGAACIEGVCSANSCNLNNQCSNPNLCIDHHCGCTTSSTCNGGLCVSGNSGAQVCMPCNDPTDDSACQTDYSVGHLCIDGSCLPADCRSDGECGGGEICCNNFCSANECCGVDDATHCDAISPGFVCDSGGTCVCPDRPAGTIVVDQNGSDSVGNGSSACPLRSISHALTLADSDPSVTVTIEVQAGTYDAPNGESFPLVLDRTGIVLAGAGAPSTTVTSFNSILLRLDQPATISGLTLSSTGAAAAVVDVGTSGQILNVDVIGAGATTTACVVGHNGSALVLGPGGTISNCDIGVLVNSGGVVSIMGAMILDNLTVGVQFNDSATTNATSLLDGATVQGNGSDGVAVTLNSRVKIRNSVITDNAESGVRALGASVQIDLGTLVDPGRNTLNNSIDPNGGVGVCNLTGRTLDAVTDVWSNCPPSVDINCSNGADINGNINAANCASQ